MELFLPSLLVVFLALTVVLFLFPRMAPLMLAILATVGLGIGVHDHLKMFRQDYETMTWTTAAASAAPYVLVGVVILFSIGYLLYLWGAGKRIAFQGPPGSIPPPESATNVLTSAIGNSLKATGLASVSAFSARRGPGSAGSSLNRLTTAERESIASKIA